MDPSTKPIDLAEVEVLSFDCYGTLIDWETGITQALRRAIPLDAAGDEQLLESYAGHEAEAESGPWLPYREVLQASMTRVCHGLGIVPTADDVAAFGQSAADWPPFPDSAAALGRLAARYELAAITNCDDDLFEHSNAKLGHPFTWVVTAQQVGAYKPSRRNFEVALKRIDRPLERLVHVAQSLYHDHVPARHLGLKSVWINRRGGRSGAGATPPADASPDMEFADMASFADFALGTGQRDSR